MYYCPYCGTSVKEEEHFCINCGEKLPVDLEKRLNHKKRISKYWIIPLLAMILIIAILGTLQLFLQNKIANAKEYYNQGELHISEGDYQEAILAFEKSKKEFKGFPQATFAIDFTNIAIQIEETINQAQKLSEIQQYQEAITILNNAENDLNNYNGVAVNDLINIIKSTHDSIKIAQLSLQLEQNPSIDELKILLWDAEAIGSGADNIIESIRTQIIDYSFTKASELINTKQFSDAYLFVEDALKYAPNSEKLNSLKTTIDKEKTAFETAQQQRIEQAMNIAEADQKFNENDAVNLVSAEINYDENGNLVIKGQVESAATIPINSILIQYSLLTESGNEILTNEVFVYPDTLYPEERGNFEFTHFDINDKENNYKIKVNKITWYTD